MIGHRAPNEGRVLVYHGSNDVGVARGFADEMLETLPWHVLELPELYATAVTAGLAVLAAPIFYVLRRLRLRLQYNIEYCIFKDLAGMELGPPIGEGAQGEEQAALHNGATADEASNWFAVLGIQPSASVDEIKSAYRDLIKQNHPDRVHGMSGAFRELAEVNTRKINIAYQEALVCGTAR